MSSFLESKSCSLTHFLVSLGCSFTDVNRKVQNKQNLQGIQQKLCFSKMLEYILNCWSVQVLFTVGPSVFVLAFRCQCVYARWQVGHKQNLLSLEKLQYFKEKHQYLMNTLLRELEQSHVCQQACNAKSRDWFA